MYNTVLYFTTVLIWGSTWIAINYQYGMVSEAVSLAYRFGLASLVLFAYCLLRKLPLTFGRSAHIRFALLALCLFAFNYYFLYLGQKHINSALSAITFSTILILNIMNSAWLFKTPITAQILVGAVIGLLGVTVLFWPEVQNTDFAQATLLGIGLCLIGTVIASCGNMISVSNQQKALPIVQSNAYAMGYGALTMVLMALWQGDAFVIDTRPTYLLSLLYLAIFGSVIAFGCYLSLLSRIGPQRASYATILFPVVATLIATWVEEFQWSLFTYLGFLLIILGNMIIVYRPASVSAVWKSRFRKADAGLQ